MNETLLALAITAAMDSSVWKVPGSGGGPSVRYHDPHGSLSMASKPPTTPTSAGPESSRRHDVAFWKGIRDRNFAVPEGESADDLLRELAQYTGSPDPELRDDLAYEIAAAWIYRDGRASNDTLKFLLERWEANLKFHVGEQGGNSTLLRSFSTLNLSVLAALDLKKPFLDKNEFDRLLAATLEYLRAEKDLRALDSRVGWIHATAHTADLLKFLARNDRLQPADATRILDAIDEKLARVGEPFTHGEDERLARAVLSLVLRSDADAVPVQAFASKLAARQRNLWKTSSRPEPGVFASAQNGVNLLKSLCVLLDEQPTLKAPADAVRRKVLEELR